MSKKMVKRSLALGALMAFVITGSAMSVAEAKTIPVEGVKTTMTGNSDTYVPYEGHPCSYIRGGWAGEEWAVGGWSDSAKIVSGTVLNSDITVSGGQFNTVVAGNSCNPNDMKIDSTKVVVNGATAKQLIGGSVVSEVNGSFDRSDMITSVTVVDGVIGADIDNTNCPELILVGGDLLKTGGSTLELDSTIGETNVVIEGGNIYAAVYGGSVADRYYAGWTSGSVDATVKEANVTITGGTFNDAVVAGGLAWGHHTNSLVEKAALSITGGTFNSGVDIYAGGMIGCINQTTSIVENSEINIKNVVVNNIYGTGGIVKEKQLEGTWVDGFGKYDYSYSQNADAIVNTTLKLTNVTADNVDIPKGSVTLRVEGNDENSYIKIGQSEGMDGLTVADDDSVPVSVEADGEVNDAYAGDYKKMVEERFKVNGYELIKDEAINDEAIENFTVEEGEVMGAATLNEDGTVTVQANQGNTGIKDIAAIGLMSWRYEMNDMNKRMGELRNANGEHGVWVRMVRGETEYNSVKNQYNQYQLGYDEKLSVDPSWTVGVALSYTEADNNFSKGTGESTNKAFSVYGSKLNDDGSFIDLIAKYARLENDFDLGTAKGDYDTNGYSVSAEYGKRFQQGKGLWIEPQVELTYGQVDSVDYMVGGRTVNQDSMESLVGRIGFSLGKDIEQGNVYARASYLYDFEGETSATFSKGSATDSFKQDLGGGWWEVGVGANINLSKATYIYADIEKTFGGEVDTNWQWNLGVRYSF